jgi:hypothetical protein
MDSTTKVYRTPHQSNGRIRTDTIGCQTQLTIKNVIG